MFHAFKGDLVKFVSKKGEGGGAPEIATEIGGAEKCFAMLKGEGQTHLVKFQNRTIKD